MLGAPLPLSSSHMARNFSCQSSSSALIASMSISGGVSYKADL